ncbi:MAG: hypothetical protein PHE55_19695 [Methylococcaceae bacterium]|nr:hypothetical protein [Methylococcaceae bacterium]
MSDDISNVLNFNLIEVNSAPTVALGSAGNITGHYRWTVTFITANGETDLRGGITLFLDPVAQQINITNIPIGPAGVIARRLYRSNSSGAGLYALTTINDNTATSYMDNTDDSGLGITDFSMKENTAFDPSFTPGASVTLHGGGGASLGGNLVLKAGSGSTSGGSIYIEPSYSGTSKNINTITWKSIDGPASTHLTWSEGIVQSSINHGLQENQVFNMGWNLRNNITYNSAYSTFTDVWESYYEPTTAGVGWHERHIGTVYNADGSGIRPISIAASANGVAADLWAGVSFQSNYVAFGHPHSVVGNILQINTYPDPSPYAGIIFSNPSSFIERHGVSNGTPLLRQSNSAGTSSIFALGWGPGNDEMHLNYQLNGDKSIVHVGWVGYNSSVLIVGGVSDANKRPVLTLKEEGGSLAARQSIFSQNTTTLFICAPQSYLANYNDTTVQAAAHIGLDNTGTLTMRAAGALEWSLTANVTGAVDTGIARSAAGVVEINNGAAGQYRDLKARSLKPAIGGMLGDSTLGWGALYLDYTNTATVGAVTINKPSGRVNVAAGGTSIVVTNSLVTEKSHVMACVSSNDTTAYVKNVVPVAGSFTINLGTAASAQASIDFLVINAD